MISNNTTENITRQKRKAKLLISVDGKNDIIYVGLDVIRILGTPKYVYLLVNKYLSSLAIRPCNSKGYMSFKVPEDLLTRHSCQFKIHSKSFVAELLSANGLNKDLSHSFNGFYYKKENAVVVNISED